MISVIVFTKDRPMQLEAYLESLIYYSNLNEQQISIIFKENKKIGYKKVIHKYSNCNWIYEDNFYENLIETIDASNNFIMFGCDDVVFKKNLPINYAKNLLSNNKDIFGFSFRLGKNIKPVPKNAIKVNSHLEWNWASVNEAHYNYPWELDCTLYRKSDIQDVLRSTNEFIKNPNYLESIFANNSINFIKRPKLACADDINQAIVITINRVQNTHLNPTDSSQNTSIEHLNYLYNEKNKKLDIHKISQLKNTKIHVGSEYFILEGDGLIKSSNYVKNIKIFYKKISRFIKNLIKNFIFLIKNDLGEIAHNSSKENLNLMFDNLKFEIAPSDKENNKPKIKNTIDTINEIIIKRASFCRFGDGEFMLMAGSSIPFQKYNSELASRLKGIFKSSIDNIFIGIPHFYFYNESPLRDLQKYFVRTWVAKNRKLICDMANMDNQYYDTASTQIYALYDNYDYSNYFSKIKQIFKGRDLIVICGESVFNRIENNIFDSADSAKYVFAPSKDAFSNYDVLLSKALSWDKKSLIIIILGPTATVLAFDLASLGFQALDFGHIAKDYDFYKKSVRHNSETISSFYLPD
jgi:glycosyltransferase family protein